MEVEKVLVMFLATDLIHGTFICRYRILEVHLEGSLCKKMKTVGLYQLEVQGTDVRILLKFTLRK
jgi:hypothetical protein